MAATLRRFALFSLLTGAVAAMDSTLANSAANPLRLWQTTAGVTYNDSFLIGNGRLGFSLPGSALTEAITLNEDSFWSGGKMDRVNPDAAANMPQIQQLITQGRIEEAATLAGMAYKGLPDSVRHYDWLGRLHLAMKGPAGQAGNYERWLDVGEGLAGVDYTLNGTAFSREYLASFPDQIIAVRIKSNQSRSISFTLSQSRGSGLNRFQDYTTSLDGDTILMGGGSMGSDAIVFSSGAKVTVSGGSIKTIGETIVVSDADSAVIYWTAWTTYRKPKEQLRESVLVDLRTAAAKGYDAIRSEHVKDYQKLADRVDLSLGMSSSEQKSKSTAQRLRGMSQAFDPEMATLYFYFARYLLIASGRPGTLPANLQGIWNTDISPQWGSKYTVNINLQMNYWPALLTNMPELHHSLLDHLKIMHENGKDVARRMYNASGSVCHHNTDLWGDCAPQDNYAASTFWPTGLGWLVTHVYEHYLFTGDEQVLRDYYPVLQDSALFFLDFLTEYQGHLVTNPSVSPEIQYYLPNSTTRQGVALTLGPTCDNSIIWEVFGLVFHATEILGNVEGKELQDRLKSARARLPPLRRDQYGGLAEFIHDYTEDEPGHRHFSQLFGLFPGSQITSSTSLPFEAAKRSLARRLGNGGGDTGWSRAWSIALAARLLDADGVAKSYNHLLVNLTYPNSMLDINAPSAFQLDGNYGGVTIVEAIVQSHELVTAGGTAATLGDDTSAHHLIRLLPALPRQWATNGGGHAKGLLTRGGFQLDVHWDDQARLTNATLTSLNGNTVWVTLGATPLGHVNGTSAAIEVDGHGNGIFVKLPSEKDKTYVVKRTRE
ncbi:hypothetical protein MCOR04_000886 [Pyricularia oryzae]|nr:hypothetical protein MCOR04_000886 [Pyricularia oryzae]